MGQTIRIALPTYNALTDTNPDHFALYADEDWVLVKEKLHNSLMIGAGSHVHITHSLGYVPFVIVFGKTSGEKWSLLQGDASDLTAKIEVSTTELIIYNNDGVNAHAFDYYIFHDQQV